MSEQPLNIVSLPQEENPVDTNKQKVTFSQIKSNLFRVIHTDGIWCSTGPYNQVHLTFFSERSAIPTQTSYEVNAAGNIDGEHIEERKGRSGWVREMEADVVLSPKSAGDLYAYLAEYVNALKPKPENL